LGVERSREADVPLLCRFQPAEPTVRDSVYQISVAGAKLWRRLANFGSQTEVDWNADESDRPPDLLARRVTVACPLDAELTIVVAHQSRQLLHDDHAVTPVTMSDPEDIANLLPTRSETSSPASLA
jgi:hypothetical protein